MAWIETTLGDLVTLQRGFDLPNKDRIPGEVPVLSAGEKLSNHNEAKVSGPGFVIGRSSNLGVPRWSDEDFWPLNTTLFAKDFKGNNPRWLFVSFSDARPDRVQLWYRSGILESELHKRIQGNSTKSAGAGSHRRCPRFPR